MSFVSAKFFLRCLTLQRCIYFWSTMLVSLDSSYSLNAFDSLVLDSTAHGLGALSSITSVWYSASQFQSQAPHCVSWVKLSTHAMHIYVKMYIFLCFCYPITAKACHWFIRSVPRPLPTRQTDEHGQTGRPANACRPASHTKLNQAKPTKTSKPFETALSC